MEDSQPAVRATENVSACSKREALPAERRGGSESGPTWLDRWQVGKALAAKNRVISTALDGANRRRSA
jgi:hypothetical protein